MSLAEFIRAIFIFEKKSGRPFVRRTYGNFQAEPFLVMGFLNAIMKFSKEVGKSDLRMIDLQDLRFFFTEKENVIITAITHKSVSALELKFKIKTIESLFLERFKAEELADIGREIEYFEDFIPVIDEIVRGDVRYLDYKAKKKLKEVLENLITDGFSGAAVFSFNGVIFAESLSEKQREIFLKFFDGIFCSGVSSISRVIIDTYEYSIFISALEEDCFLIVFDTNKRFQDSDIEKISEIVLELNSLIIENSIS